jgi:hypothetical protein
MDAPSSVLLLLFRHLLIRVVGGEQLINQFNISCIQTSYV